MSFYNHRLHNEYEQKINTEINIRIKLFKELELYKKIIQDETRYPDDQESAYYFHYPLAGNRTIPEFSVSDYVTASNNYKKNGNLFTVRFLNPEDRYCEVIFVDPNDNGQVWLFIIAPNLGDVEEIKKYANINLETGQMENVYF
jgi:hypothetical protein